MDELQVKETWDVKRILIGLVLVGVLSLSFKTLVLDKKVSNGSIKSTAVEGAAVQENPSPGPQLSSGDIKKDVQTKLDDLKKQVDNINVVEIATSTPAVKKVISDLKNLQEVPQNQVKEACFKICNGL